MRIGNFDLIIVCANYDKEVGGYGDIYNSLSECKKEHPNDEVIFGYYLVSDNDIETPDWFDTIDEAIDWVENLASIEDCSCKGKTLEEKIECMKRMQNNTVDDRYDKGFFNGIEYCLSLLEDRAAKYKYIGNNIITMVKSILTKELKKDVLISDATIDKITREIVEKINC